MESYPPMDTDNRWVCRIFKMGTKRSPNSDKEIPIRETYCRRGWYTVEEVNNLTYDNFLSEQAQAHADWMADHDWLVPSRNLAELNQGENIYSKLILSPHPIDATRVLHEDPDEFTQMIWADTKRVGFGVAVKANGLSDGVYKSIIYIAARYSPPGNSKYAFHENVMTTEFDYSRFCSNFNQNLGKWS
ncbi:hypothetical protein ACOME3_005832 [Neoechinorhynchus agilis]